MSRFTKTLSLFALSSLISVNALAHSAVKTMSGDNVRTGNGSCLLTQWNPNMAHESCSSTMMHKMKVFFAEDSYKLGKEQIHKLNNLTKVLKDKDLHSVHIYGHTDHLGTKEENATLSEARAISVYDYLRSKINLSGASVTTQGVGESHPVKTCNKMKGSELVACLAPNRRVEVSVTWSK